MNLIKCIQRNSTCYKNTTQGKPVGVLWHDTGAGNPELKRYVQPLESDADYSAMMGLIGENRYKNDWNHVAMNAGLNAWIGRLADGSVATVQAMPWDYRPWGCGTGWRGSCNGETGGAFWIQFEICDDYANGQPERPEYFQAAYREAVELTAHLCKLYGIDPTGSVDYKGTRVPTILCHKDSSDLGLGSNHGDVYTWFNKHGKSMDDVRRDVAALLSAGAETPPEQPKEPEQPAESTVRIGDLVEIKSGAKYYTGKSVPEWVMRQRWYVAALSWGRAIINASEDGKYHINSPINTKYLTAVSSSQETPERPWEPAVGERVYFAGGKHYKSATDSDGSQAKPGEAVITKIYVTPNSKHPYHLINEKGGGSTVYGWVDREQITRIE